MTVGDKVRIVGQSRFATRTGTITALLNEEIFRYVVAIDGYKNGVPIPFMENEVVKREETE
jgi:hypothetical protein